MIFIQCLMAYLVGWWLCNWLFLRLVERIAPRFYAETRRKTVDEIAVKVAMLLEKRAGGGTK